MKLSLYRKYRPQTFAQVVAQEHVARTLTHAIETNSVAHAYIFAGPRGIGKTSMAKILAKALNCTGADGSITAPTVTPCGVCESCRSIAAGTALDVVEMDAASNRGIDDMRELRDKIAFVPVQGRSKVYIIDEAHMLTKEAFNALLKTLEEPPANVVFVLATTEPHKIIATILSRCQRFDFRRPLTRDIMKVLRQIIAAENEAAAAGDPDAQTIAIDDDALAVIAEYADGGFRDAIGTLDKLATQFSGSISRKDLDKVLGTINSELLFEITDIIIERDSAGALLFVQQLADQSKNYQQFIVNLLRHLRQLFVVQHVGALHELQDEQRTRLERALEQSTHLVTERLEQITAQANQLDERQLIYVIETLGRAQGEIKSGLDARLQLELALVKATRPQLDHSVAALEERLRRLETAQLPLGATSLSMPAAPVPVAATQAPAAAGEPAKPAAAATAAAATASAPATAASSVAGDALAPTPSAASELSLTRIESAWALVLQRLQATDAPLAAALATARPAQLADGHLTVAVGSSFALTAASGPGNGALVADAVEHILGQRPTIAFTLASRHRPTTDTAAGTAKSGPAGHTNAEPSDSQVMPAGPATDEAAPTPPASSIPSDAPAQASLSFAEKIRLVEKELDAKILSDEQ
jgi:DNA polymerase-3 subunit gamma/tau